MRRRKEQPLDGRSNWHSKGKELPTQEAESYTKSNTTFHRTVLKLKKKKNESAIFKYILTVLHSASVDILRNVPQPLAIACDAKCSRGSTSVLQST